MGKVLANTSCLKLGRILEKTLEKVFYGSSAYYSKKCNCPKHNSNCKHPDNCKCECCRKPIRGCLPWETQEYKKCLEQKISDGMDCNCKSPELAKKLTLSLCEYRRLEKCMKTHKDPKKCLVKMEMMDSKKTYPLIHAVTKDYIPGCPVSSWQKLYTNDQCS